MNLRPDRPLENRDPPIFKRAGNIEKGQGTELPHSSESVGYYLMNGVNYYAKRKGKQTVHSKIKEQIIETMMTEKGSCREAAQWFEISGHKLVTK